MSLRPQICGEVRAVSAEHPQAAYSVVPWAGFHFEPPWLRGTGVQPQAAVYIGLEVFSSSSSVVFPLGTVRQVSPSLRYGQRNLSLGMGVARMGSLGSVRTEAGFEPRAAPQCSCVPCGHVP